MRKFLIFTPPYSANSGGAVCLHKLAHLINTLGYEAYLYPSFVNDEISIRNLFSPAFTALKSYIGHPFKSFETNPSFNTPILNSYKNQVYGDEWIVIYPEVIFGNPLFAKNIVRWLLHQPGYHTKKIYYGEGELHVRFNQAIKPFYYPNSTLAEYLLPIIHYPLELYSEKDVALDRSGTAFCIRKGRKKFISQKSGDILIDNLKHEEVAKIFKRVERFISYDSYTAYSRFAALCGCDSIVVPDSGVKECEWYPNPVDRYGVSYGFEGVEKARKTKSLLLEKIIKEHKSLEEITMNFIFNANKFF